MRHNPQTVVATDSRSSEIMIVVVIIGLPGVDGDSWVFEGQKRASQDKAVLNNCARQLGAGADQYMLETGYSTATLSASRRSNLLCEMSLLSMRVAQRGLSRYLHPGDDDYNSRGRRHAHDHVQALAFAASASSESSTGRYRCLRPY